MARGINWRPTVTKGHDLPIPESRPDVLQKILKRLDKEGPFLQRYSNGEFITSSIAVARTLEECKKVQVLDCAGHVIHYDPVNKLFWRHGGSFD